MDLLETAGKVVETVSKLFGTYNQSVFFRIHSYLVNQHFFYYDTFECYHARQAPTFKKRFTYYLPYISLFLGIVKYGLLLIYRDIDIQVQSGEFILAFFDNYSQIDGYILSSALVFLILKISLAYYELGHKVNFEWFKLKYETSFFNLSMQNQHKLILMTNVLYWLFFLIEKALFIVWPIFFLFLIGISYIFTYYQYNLFILMMYTILFLYAYDHICKFFTHIIISFLILVNFLRWKQDEIIKSMQFNLLMRNNKNSILISKNIMISQY